MKIVDVAEFYSEKGGGVRTYLLQKLAAAAACGHEIVIIAPGGQDAEERRPGGRILWVKSPHEFFDRNYYRFDNDSAVFRLLDAEKPDVVEGSSPWRGGRIVGRWPGSALKSFIMHMDTVAVYPQTLLDRWLKPDTIDRLFGWFWSYLARLSDRYDTTIVAGEWLARRAGRFGMPRVTAIPFGVDKARFSPHLRSTALRAELLAACGLPENARLLVTISRHHPEKRLSTLIDAVARLRDQQHEVGLYIVGDGPMRRSVERLAARVPGVFVAGAVRDRNRLAAILASADAMIHGSAAETYGLVIAEALCSGLPIVVPHSGGAADLAHPSYSETYAPGDAAGCADAIARLLARDGATLSMTARAASIQRIVTPEQHFSALFDHYERLIQGRDGAKPHRVAKYDRASAA